LTLKSRASAGTSLSRVACVVVSMFTIVLQWNVGQANSSS
jgi:hypothetical protein